MIQYGADRWLSLGSMHISTMTMFRLLVLVLLLVHHGIGMDDRCGPHDNCTCSVNTKSKTISMDCSKRGVSICDVCDVIGNTTHLDVSSNNITMLDNNCLWKCRGLTSLILSYNYIRRIAGVFNGFDRLRLLDLSFNVLDIYERNGRHSLEHLPNLTELKLQHNRGLSKNCSYPDISHLPSLDILYIDGISDAKFDQSYEHLKKLFMSGFSGFCNLGLITNFTFLNLKQIAVLDISFCSITNIHAGGFRELHKLEYLNMSHNQQLGFATFRNVSYGLQFTNIKSLNMSKMFNTFGVGTTVRKRDICYLRNTTLEEIVLDSNRMALFETNALQLFPPSIRVFHLNDNCYTCAPYILQFSCVPHVTEMYSSFQNTYHDPHLYLVEKQDMEVLEEKSTDDCPFMTDEYLQNISNSMESCPFINAPLHGQYGMSLPRGLRKCVTRDCNMRYPITRFLYNPPDNVVEYIDISGNSFYSWQGPVGPFFHLKYLDISRNYCSNVSTVFFKYAPFLENLQIQHNFIGLTLSDKDGFGIFNDLGHLKTLNLSQNHITSIAERSFSSLHALTSLDLSFNDIGQWTVNLREMPNLTHLNISFNALRTLPDSLISHFDSLVKTNATFSINYKGNTVACSCENRKFLHWLLKHKANFVDYEQYTFEDMDGKAVTETRFENVVEKIDKRCASYTIYIIVSVLALSIALSIMIGGMIYKKRWKLRYLLYMSKNRFFGYRRLENEDVLENYKYDAFISYAEENIRFILDGVIPELDRLSLCIHQRDFVPGHPVIDNIIDAIQTSRRTVVILSKAFLKSTWCMYEFNMARMESIYTRPGQRTLIIVMFEDVPIKDMPNEMSHWISTESYLEYTDDRHGQTVFWNQLAHALGQEDG